MKKEAHYVVQVREPYMGNWVSLKIKMIWDREGELQAIWVINPEGIASKAEPDPDVETFTRPDV